MCCRPVLHGFESPVEVSLESKIYARCMTTFGDYGTQVRPSHGVPRKPDERKLNSVVPFGKVSVVCP